MPGSVIVSGVRTPIGKLGGALSTLSAAELGGRVIAEALRRAGIEPEAVDFVAMGQVIQAGQGQNPARQAAARAGVPLSTPSMTINKVCLSGLETIHYADLLIGAGEADVVVAGGMESMSGAPYLVEGARNGFRFGDAALRDAIVADGLTDAFLGLAMGAATDRDAAAASISRDAQDAVAHSSHERAARARKEGRFADEIMPVAVPQRRGEDVLVTEDEGVRGATTLESLARLAPAFEVGGTVTAGNASQISDGAAAVVVTSRAVAVRLGLEPLAEVAGYASVAGPDTSLLLQPARALARAAERLGLRVEDLDAIEINEAFAAVAVASSADLDIPLERLNVNGGAIALGHPVGMSGTRLALTLALELGRLDRTGAIGAAALCGGGGLGDALVLRGLR